MPAQHERDLTIELFQRRITEAEARIARYEKGKVRSFDHEPGGTLIDVTQQMINGWKADIDVYENCVGYLERRESEVSN